MTFASDLRYALRSFLRTPGLTATLVLSIGLGVGGNAAMFAFVGGLVALEVDGADPAAADRFGQVAVLLVAASALVLFLACSTVAGLLMSRARTRAHEMAVRIALGASRGRLGALCLADSIVISALGGGVGVVFGWWAASLFPLLFFAEDAEQLAMSPDPVWLLTAAGIWVSVMLVAATAPVVTVPRLAPWSVLRRETAGVSGDSSRLRRRIAMAQIAVCCLLLLLAGMIRADLRTTLRTSRGLGLSTLLVVPVEADPEYFRAAEDKVREVPGVSGTAWVSTLPGGRAPVTGVRVERIQPRTRPLQLGVSVLEPEQLDAEDLRPVAGRNFGAADGPTAPRVAVVNVAAAERYFDGDPVGHLLEQANGPPVELIGVLAYSDDAQSRPQLFYYANQVPPSGNHREEVFYALPLGPRTPAEVGVVVASTSYFGLFADPPTDGRTFGGAGGPPVGRIGVISEEGAERLFDGDAVGGALITSTGGRINIVGVVRGAALGAAQRRGAPVVTVPLSEADESRMTLAIRSRDVSETTRFALQDAMDLVPGGRSLAPISTFEEHLVRNALAGERVATVLLAVSAAMALVMSITGIHGTMADLVARRRPELALRIALGARALRLIGGVVRAGLSLALVGAGVGLGVAVLVRPLIGRIIQQPNLPSMTVLGVAGLAIAILVGVACAVPAWRAVTVDPREVMR